jgi:hypothetical protein
MNFTNLIAQIAQGRAQTETQKSTARLNALMQLRNEAFQVQQQKVLEESQLTQMREQARLNIDAYQQTTGGAIATGQNAYDQFSNQANTPMDYSKFGTNQQATANPYTGSISNKKFDYTTGKWVS